MWTVVYMAHNEADQQRIKTLLRNEGILVKVKRISKEDSLFEILVLKEEVTQAHEILMNC